MAAHADGALKVARFLEKHKGVKRVLYPGLASFPQYELACRQMANMSGMLTFQVADGRAMVQRFVERLRIFHYAVSLGHHRSLVFYLPTDELHENSFRFDAEHLERFRQWAGDGIFRVSIGLEDAEDLCADLDQALGGAVPAGRASQPQSTTAATGQATRPAFRPGVR
jgi:methionine-gamma-lyase